MLRVASGFFLLLLVGHSAAQIWLVWRHRRRRSRAAPSARESPARWPSVDVIVPCYNEDPAALEACLDALKAAACAYQGKLRTYLIDDGSPNIAALRPIYERYSTLEGWSLQLLPHNAGKRRAQDAAVHKGSGAFVVTVDSDTVIAPDGVERLIEAFRCERAGRIGAVAGRVDVSNKAYNLLTRLIASRYRVVYRWERPAQDTLGAVMCCSGPFTAYRRTALTAVWPRYISQSFRGISCTYGDDRHLANLLLASNFLSCYEPDARAWTTAPTTMREYANQQLRWNRSFYREVLWILPWLPRRFSYLALDVATRALMPLLFGLVVSVTIVVGIPTFVASGVVPESARLLVVMALAQILGNLWQSRDPRFAILYSILHAGLLFPVRLHALLTLADNRWSTRTRSAMTPRQAFMGELRSRVAGRVQRFPMAAGPDPSTLTTEAGSSDSIRNTPA
jgi:N-acetylglucosaminyltransferase